MSEKFISFITKNIRSFQNGKMFEHYLGVRWNMLYVEISVRVRDFKSIPLYFDL